MPLTLHNLKPFLGSRKRRKRIGRGDASGHGTYSTRGLKGQRSRSGGKKGLKLKGIKRIIISLPKIGGFKSIHLKPVIINISTLVKHFDSGEKITPRILLKKGLIDRIKPEVKILDKKGLKGKKFFIENCKVSKSVKEEIEKAGGVVK